MNVLAVWSWVSPFLNIVLLLTGLFLILLVLIQRGKGGGLAGAFGGVGGSSAFGSRAGDTFTKVTIITGAAWLLLIMIQDKILMGELVSRSTPTTTVQPVESPTKDAE